MSTPPSPGPAPLRPPVHRVSAYYLFGARVPYSCRYWVREDVLRPWYLTRHIACSLAFWLAAYGVVVPLALPLALMPVVGEYYYLGPPHWWVVLVAPAVMLVLTALLELLFPAIAGPSRRTVLRRHGFRQDGTPIVYPPVCRPNPAPQMNPPERT